MFIVGPCSRVGIGGNAVKALTRLALALAPALAPTPVFVLLVRVRGVK